MSIKYNIIQTPITKATHAKYCVRPVYKTYADLEDIAKRISDGTSRSEERRGGKECLRLCRSGWSPQH